MKNYINSNGRLLPAEETAVPYDNRAFRYGHGLFETMLVQNGRIDLKEYHWKRLFAGMEQLYIKRPRLWTAALLEHAVLQTVRKNGLEALARARLQVWNGNGGLYDPAGQPSFLIECFPLDPAVLQLNENGLTVGIATGLQKSMDDLSPIKSCSALIYTIAARQAAQHKWNDALICNTRGHIIESTIANIFWIREDKIHTPPLSEGCIAGIMRQYLLDLLPAKGYPVTEQELTLQDLESADEIFLTNSIRKIKWISNLSSKNYSNHFITQLIKSM